MSRLRRRAWLVAFNGLGLLVVAGLLALGAWQVERRAWKHALIARVEARVRAAPVPAPSPAERPAVTAAEDAYRHVALSGRYLTERTTLVQAVTERGGGSWVLTPLRTDRGFTVLVNRGFVPADRRDPATWRRAEGESDLTGLLRVSEPGGAFLRANDPAADRWTSRDVAAIAAARGLSEVAPYFVDADAVPSRAGYPVAGLTVVSFTDNHLVYAITWFVLAMMAAGAVVYVDRDVVLAARAASRNASAL